MFVVDILLDSNNLESIYYNPNIDGPLCLLMLQHLQISVTRVKE